MIIQSYKKQKRKSVLIFIQLFISSFCLALGIGFFEINMSHISKVKSMIGTDVIYTVINTKTSFQDIDENQRVNINKFYNDIKADERVMLIGTYDVGYVSAGVDSDRPNSIYKDRPVIIMDDSFFHILRDEEQRGIFKEQNNNEFTMALGSNISCVVKNGEKVYIHNPNSHKNYVVTANTKIDKNINFLSKSSSGYITNNIISTENTMFVLLPEYEKNTCNDKYFIKLKNGVECEEFINYVDNLGKRYGLENYTHDINNEVEKYIQRNKIPMIGSITLSGILLILSSIGLVGVILASILQRKKEFGIRYSLGCTPYELMKLIVGEIMILFVISTLLGLIVSYITSIFIDNMKIGLLTISFSSGIMFIFCLIASFIPAKRIINMNPISLINRGCD